MLPDLASNEGSLIMLPAVSWWLGNSSCVQASPSSGAGGLLQLSCNPVSLPLRRAWLACDPLLSTYLFFFGDSS